MVDFSEIADLIADVIQSEGLGATVTLTKVTPGTYDAATGSVTNTTATYSAPGIVEEYVGEELILGLAAAGDKKISIPSAALSVVPMPSDIVTAFGTAYAIVSVQVQRGGDTAIMYILQGRKA